MQKHNDMEITAVDTPQRYFRNLPKALSCAVLLAAASGGTTLLPTMVAAQEQASEGGKARVSRSGSLRSLTEVVASASCRMNGQFDAAQAQADLAKATDDFSAIISGLINGNPALGMPAAERSPRMLSSLEATADLWAPLEA